MNEIIRIPHRTRFGAWLCRHGWHKWESTGNTQRVIPTGNALIVSQRVENHRCGRYGCTATKSKEAHNRNKGE